MRNSTRTTTLALRISALACAASLAACGTWVIEAVRAHEDPPREAAELAARPGTFILDVSDYDEQAAGHIEGAVRIPKGQLFHRMDELPTEKEVFILVYDLSGRRSGAAGLLLIDEGYDHVHELAGGLKAWQREGFPVVPDDVKPKAGL